jgi:NAD(P)H-dependent FMN reductase
MTFISVIVGSTREGRFSEKPAKWILQLLKKREGVNARLLDLRDFPMPFFDQPATPGRPPFAHEVVQKWTAAIAQSDGFVFVTPEYNYGPSAVLKNAIDWVYPEWNRKPVSFVSYGSAMGVRSVQQLRETAIELQLAPDSLIGPHPCRHLVGSLPRRRCRRWTGRAGGACPDADRRSLVVDRSLEDGARKRVLSNHRRWPSQNRALLMRWPMRVPGRGERRLPAASWRREFPAAPRRYAFRSAPASSRRGCW